MNLSAEFHPVPKPKKQLKSKSSGLKRTPMKKRRSKRARSKEFPNEVKQLVWERSGGMCERCKRRRLMHYHHCHFRSEGNACKPTLDNCLGLCNCCHLWDADSVHKSQETRQWCIKEAAKLAQEVSVWTSRTIH